MSVENPLPAAAVLLAPLLVLIALTGVAWVERAVRDRALARILGPGLGLALWLLVVHLLGRHLGRFVPAYVVGTVAVAAPGAVVALRALRRGLLDGPTRRASGRVLAASLFATVLILPAVTKFFHDEMTLSGHLAAVGQIQNGWYPPRFSVFPDHEFRYHYGFDLLAAMISGMFRLSSATAIDVTTVGLWLYAALLLASYGRHVTGSRHGAATVVTTLFAGGLPFTCPSLTEPVGHLLNGFCKVEDIWLGPPLSSLFFQHPFGLGIPLGVLALSLAARRPARVDAWRTAALGVLLAALSFSHIVVFCTVAGVVFAGEWFGRGVDWRAGVAATLALAAALVLARLAGGFFAPGPRSFAMLQWHLGPAATLAGGVRWSLYAFGVLLPLGIVGLFFLRRERLVLGLLMFGSVGVLWSVKHATSWDVVKFAAITTLACGITVSAVVVRLLELSRKSATAQRWGLRALAVVATLGTTAGGMAFHVAIWLELDGARYDGAPYALGPDHVAVVNRLRHQMGPSDVVYAYKNESYGYNQHAGLHVAWADYPSRHFGFAARIAPRNRLLQERPASAERWRAEGIRWVVVPRSDLALNAVAEAWLRSGAARIDFEHGNLRLLHIL